VVFLVYFVHLVEQNKSDEPDKGDRETSSVKKQGTAMETRDAVEPMIPWWAGGLGGVLILAVALVQPIGVSTEYVALRGVLLHQILPEVAGPESVSGEDCRRVDAA
jgi:hypothetical protein